MSFTLLASTEVNDALLDGGLAGLLNSSTNPSHAVLYDATDTALVTIVFGNPAVSLVNHSLEFAQANISGDMILVQGDAVKFDLFTGAMLHIGFGDVSDPAGTGALKISGTTGTTLYAGARCVLDELKLSLAVS